MAYPGSTLVKDFFRKADRGRYIDTGTFSNPTQLIRQYRLREPVTRAEFDRWRNSTYPLPGWRVQAIVDGNRTMYARTVGKRRHGLEVYAVGGGPDSALVPEYGITYSVR